MTTPRAEITGLEYAENAAFAIRRSLPGYDVPIDQLIAFARRLITEALDDDPDAEEQGDGRWDIHNRRKFDSPAQVIAALAEQASFDAATRSSLYALAALAFCLDGNHVCGRVAGRAALRFRQADIATLVSLGVACPTLTIECLRHPSLSPASRGVLETAGALLEDEAPNPTQLLARLTALEKSVRAPGMGYLFTLANRCLRVAFGLRFSQILANYNFPLKPALLSGLRREGRMLALPSQVAAIVTPGLLEGSGAVLVSLPTGAGKTLVGLVAALAKLRRPQDVCVYLAPYIAIRRQVVETARSLLAESATVVSGAESVDNKGRMTLIVDTPEGFDARLRYDPTLRGRLRAVVLDEAHLLGSDARGVLADGLLTRLRLSDSSRQPTKLVLLSAVLDDDSALRNWLSHPLPAVLAQSRWRPAPRRIGLWQANGVLTWLRTIARADGSVSAFRVAGGSIPSQYPTLSEGNRNQISPARTMECNQNVSELAVRLWKRDRQCTLLIVGTRSRARSLARTVGTQIEPKSNVGPNILRTIALIRVAHAEYADLIPLLERGVTYHSAALPIVLRQAIETACAARELEFVCATTSLAEGADLPFGRTILADWTFATGAGGHQTFSPALWRNIAGRCGRPGSYLEGETIVVEATPPVAFPGAGERRAAVGRMLTGAVRLDYSLDDTRPAHSVALEQLVSQSLAAIQENPDRDEGHRVFASQLLAGLVGGGATSERLGEFLETKLLGGAQPLATRHSPLRLTARGSAIYRCPVLPDAAERIMETVARPQRLATTRAFCRALLEATAYCSELRSTALPRIVEGKPTRGLWVKREELELAVGEWLAGATVGELLLQLSARSSRTTRAERSTLQGWLTGSHVTDEWIEYHEKLMEFCRTVFADFLPRAVTACLVIQEAMQLADNSGIDLKTLREDILSAARGLKDVDEFVLRAGN